MEPLVNKLAELQARQKMEEDAADETSAWVDGQIKDAESQLKMLNTQRDELRKSHIDPIKAVIEQIVGVQQEIIDAWNPKTMKKTLIFDVGTLKFRTTQSLQVNNPGLLLDDIIRHTSVTEAGTKYISGFNKTAVKKYMDVHFESKNVAELIPKTMVKLEMG